jgi:hypothetical protein
VTLPNHRGFGTRLFLRPLEQFGGKAEATFASTGLVCKLSVRLSDLTPSMIASAPGLPSAFAADRTSGLT